MIVSNYRQYQTLSYVPTLEPGDLLIKKVFPETAKGAVEKGITFGQKLYRTDDVVKISHGRFKRTETFTFKNQGSHTSEHAAIALGGGMIAEAIENGVITASIWGRMGEKYIVYRCLQDDVREAAIKIAEGLSHAYRNVITGDGREQTSGGQYSIGGALASNIYKNPGFSENQMENWVTKSVNTLANNVKSLEKKLKPMPGKMSTNDYLQSIIDYVYGIRNDRPDMFCSEFAMACYEAGSVAARGRTAFGSDPRTMSPMRMEDIMNSHRNMVTFVGRLDSEGNPLYNAVESSVREYENGLGILRFRRQSEQSKMAVTTLQELLKIGDMEYLYAAILAFMDAKPSQPVSITYVIRATDRLSPTSTLYRILRSKLGGLITL